MNKTIFICWFQGFKNAPLIVRRSLLSWKKKNPTWNVVELTNENIKEYIDIEKDIPGIYNRNIKLAHLADIIRVHLLDKYGGVWCDATTICTTPLDNWLDNYIDTGFFAFKWTVKSSNKRLNGVFRGAIINNRTIANWFLYSNKNNFIMKKWKKKIDNFWNNNDKPKTYFIHQRMFYKLYKKNKKFKKMFDDTKDYSTHVPYYYRSGGNVFLKEPTKDVKNHIDNNKSPLYKITYKYKEKKIFKNSVINYILQTKTIFNNVNNK
jgi:hypothetical protein